ANPSFANVYRQRRTAAREMPVFAASCEMVICGLCGLNAWITSRPRASEVMKLGSPAKTSSVEACVDLAFAGATAGAVRLDARLADRSFVAAPGLAERELAAGRRDAGLIGVPSCSLAIGLPAVQRPNLKLEAKGQKIPSGAIVELIIR